MFLALLFLVVGLLSAPVGHASWFKCSRFLRDVYQHVSEPQIPPTLRGIKNHNRLRWNYEIGAAHEGSIMSHKSEIELLSGLEVYYTPGHIVLKQINEVTLDYLLAGDLRAQFDVNPLKVAGGFRLRATGDDRLAAERELFARIEKDFGFLYELELKRLKKSLPAALRPLLNLDSWDSSRRRDALYQVGRSWTHEQGTEVFNFLFDYKNFGMFPWFRDLYDFRKSLPLAYHPISRVEYLNVENMLSLSYTALRYFDTKSQSNWSEIIRRQWLSDEDFLRRASLSLLRRLAESELAASASYSSFLHLQPLLHVRPEIFYGSAPMIPRALERLRELPIRDVAERKKTLRTLLSAAIEGSLNLGSPNMLEIFDTADEIAMEVLKDSSLAALIEHLKSHWIVVNLAYEARKVAATHPGLYTGGVSPGELVLVVERGENQIQSIRLDYDRHRPSPLRPTFDRYDYFLLLRNWPQHHKELVVGNYADFLEKTGDVFDLMAELDDR